MTNQPITQTAKSSLPHSSTASPAMPPVADKPPFVLLLLTKHGQVAAVTQKNRDAPFFNGDRR